MENLNNLNFQMPEEPTKGLYLITCKNRIIGCKNTILEAEEFIQREQKKDFVRIMLKKKFIKAFLKGSKEYNPVYIISKLEEVYE